MSLSAFILSFVGLIFFSSLWINLLPIIYVSIFWLVINLLYTLWIYFGSLSVDDYFYFSVVIFNYHILLGLAIILHRAIQELIFYIFEKAFESHNLPIFLTLLAQSTLITMFVWIGFACGWNEVFKSDAPNYGWPLALNIILNFFMDLSLILKFNENNCMVLYVIIYIPMMIFYLYFFSSFIEEKYILSFLFMIFFNFFFITVTMLYYHGEHHWPYFVAYVISDVVTILPFHFFWLECPIAGRNLAIISAAVGIYIIFVYFVTHIKFEDDQIFTVVMLNQVIFILAFILIILALICLLSLCSRGNSE